MDYSKTDKQQQQLQQPRHANSPRQATESSVEKQQQQPTSSPSSAKNLTDIAHLQTHLNLDEQQQQASNSHIKSQLTNFLNIPTIYSSYNEFNASSQMPHHPLHQNHQLANPQHSLLSQFPHQSQQHYASQIQQQQQQSSSSQTFFGLQNQVYLNGRMREHNNSEDNEENNEDDDLAMNTTVAGLGRSNFVSMTSHRPGMVGSGHQTLLGHANLTGTHHTTQLEYYGQDDMNDLGYPGAAIQRYSVNPSQANANITHESVNNGQYYSMGRGPIFFSTQSGGQQQISPPSIHLPYDGPGHLNAWPGNLQQQQTSVVLGGGQMNQGPAGEFVAGRFTNQIVMDGRITNLYHGHNNHFNTQLNNAQHAHHDINNAIISNSMGPGGEPQQQSSGGSSKSSSRSKAANNADAISMSQVPENMQLGVDGKFL